MEPEKGLVGADRGADCHGLDVRPGRRSQADGRYARPVAGPVLPDTAGASVGAISGSGGSWDALFPNEWTFDSNQDVHHDGRWQRARQPLVTGKLPVNEFSATGAGAPGIGSISQSSTGGSLPANATLRVALCAIDSNGLPSAPSNIAIIGTSRVGPDTYPGGHHLAGRRGLGLVCPVRRDPG